MCDETLSPLKLQRPRVLQVSRSPSPCRVRTPSAGVPSFAVVPESTVHTMSTDKPAAANTRRENFSKENSVSGKYMLRTSKVCPAGDQCLSSVPPPVSFLTQNTYKRAHTNTDLKSKWESMIQKGSLNPGRLLQIEHVSPPFS